MPVKSRIIIASTALDDCELEGQYESIIKLYKSGISWWTLTEKLSGKASCSVQIRNLGFCGGGGVVRGKARDLDSVQTSGCQAQ